MDNLLKYWIWLSRIKGLGSKTAQKLLNYYHSPEEIWKIREEELLMIDGIGEKTAKEIVEEKYRINIEKYIDYMEKNQIECISLQDKGYPQQLKQLYDKPVVLYTKGNKEILNDFSFAMIGCRNASSCGIEVAKKIAYELAKRKITVVSGLARGIDGISQEEVVKRQGKTIAVIGSGIDTIYPEENIGLAKKIVQTGGVIVSEYLIGTKPEKMNFVARNRIISGLSQGIIVVEARKKSGSSITVDFALEQGKNVFAVPRKYYKF